jgi:hypothetical protein
MNEKFEDCWFCKKEISDKPKLELFQERYSYLCPHCEWWRGGWKDTIEEARISWNTDERDLPRNILYYSEIKNDIEEQEFLEAMYDCYLDTVQSEKTQPKKYLIKSLHTQMRLAITGIKRRYGGPRRELTNRESLGEYYLL